MWWLLRFSVGILLMPLALWRGQAPTFGIAALGDNDEKARRAIVKAQAIQRGNREKTLADGAEPADNWGEISECWCEPAAVRWVGAPP